MRVLKWLAGGVLAFVVLFWVLFIGVATWTLMGSPVSSARIADDAQTRYPIVLAHGVLGFGYIHKQSYWRDIPETLRAHGANVYVTQVSAFHSSEIRGEQLLAQVERIRKETGASKVNLIGHSHGAFSVRYVAGKRPDWVASVTSVAGPTQGSDVADWLVQLDGQHPYAAMAILELGHLMGWLINQLSDQQLPLDTRAAVTSLSALGAQDFNRQFPAGVPGHPCGHGQFIVDGVRYYSWGTVGRYFRAFNSGDYLMSVSGLAFKDEDNDGLVSRCSSHLGEVIRDDYPMNHFHSVNQLMGLVPEGVDPVGLYVEHARRLKQAGL
jgi:triacylglycerol lipase